MLDDAPTRRPPLYTCPRCPAGAPCRDCATTARLAARADALRTVAHAAFAALDRVLMGAPLLAALVSLHAHCDVDSALVLELALRDGRDACRALGLDAEADVCVLALAALDAARAGRESFAALAGATVARSAQARGCERLRAVVS